MNIKITGAGTVFNKLNELVLFVLDNVEFTSNKNFYFVMKRATGPLHGVQFKTQMRVQCNDS